MDDIDLKEIEELIAKVKNDDFIKVDREVINVDTFSKICSSMKPEKVFEYEKKAEECNRILEKLNDGMYICDEKPEIHKSEDQSDLSTIINEQRYSVSYNTVFQQNDLKEHFIVCQNNERLKEILSQLKITDNENSNEDDKTENKNIKVYKTIQEAINNASPGQSIIVDDGKYNESIVIDKTVEIKALNITDKKEPKKVEIIAESGNCFTLKANCGHLEGLKIVCGTPGNTFCTNVNSGLLELENCHLMSNSAGCFFVEQKARITIKDSELFSTYSSASLKPQSHAVIMDCLFTQPKNEVNLHPAITIDSKATCIIIDCTIESMVSFKPFSKGMLLRCHISTIGNFKKGEGNGIYIQEGAKPLIKNCKIDNCIEAGIRFDPKSKGVVDDCVITNNTTFGVLALNSEQFLVCNSHIEKNKESGLRTANNSKGDIVNTEIKGNIKNGVLIENGCDIRMKGCQILDHVDTQTAAIFIKECQDRVKRITKFALIESIVSRNLSGIMISGTSDATIFKSDITHNNQYGITIERDSKVEINDCEICENGLFQLVSPRPPANYNPAVRVAPSANSIPSTAEITAKNTKFGPYNLHCIVLFGKSITNFTQSCSFSNDYVEFLNSKINFINSDIKINTRKINAIEKLISAGNNNPELAAQKKQLQERNERLTATLANVNKIFERSSGETAQKKPTEQSIVDSYQKLKVSPFILLEGNAQCTIKDSNFKSNISFIEARDSTNLTIKNSTFYKDFLNSIKAVNNAQLNLLESTFNNAKTCVVLEEKAVASIIGTTFRNSRGFSINCAKDGWNLNMRKSSIILGMGHMVSLSGRGEANFTENSFLGQINSNDPNSVHKSGGADLAICLTGVPNCNIMQNSFKYLQRGAIEATQSAVKIIRNNLLEMHQFPLFFKNSNIEITENNIINEKTKPQNAIHIQDGCTGIINGNKYTSLNTKFLEVMGQSSSVRESDNVTQRI